MPESSKETIAVSSKLFLDADLAATLKMELFVIIVNGLQPLTITTKCFILNFAAVLDPSLILLAAQEHSELQSPAKYIGNLLGLAENINLKSKFNVISLLFSTR